PPPPAPGGPAGGGGGPPPAPNPPPPPKLGVCGAPPAPPAGAGGRFAVHKKSGADLLQARLDGRQVLIAKPRSFMNLSGRPVAALAKFFSVPPTEVIVVHDELDLPFGAIRLKRGGGEGGHNGLRSVSSALTTKDYLRARIGIGRPPGRQDPADYVLKPFSAPERKEVPVIVEQAADAVELLLRVGLETAQNQVH
ncbi:aminoacyl-tRNA hydrolase, partial [Nocardia asiatica]|uniref:aminoacyl-tRNA hydrolase n=1 Tax=Nocardia asiatica TaxID=209252 RepID=UPI002458D7F1